MAITDLERERIGKLAEFLEKLGYVKTENQHSINYSLNNVCISIIYPPDSEKSEVCIRFIDRNQVFSIGWIALVRENISGSRDRFIHVKELLKYIEKRYSQIKNYQYCLESNKLIDKYVEDHREIFENAVRNFQDII